MSEGELVMASVDGDMTTVRVGEHIVTVPTANITLSGGKMLVAVAADCLLMLAKDQVAIVAHYPDPHPAQVVQAVGSLNHGLVSALMAEESSFSSMDDSIGLIALRAVVRAISGETPRTVDSSETL